MTILTEFSTKDMGLWFQGSLVPFGFNFQIGPLTVAVTRNSVAAQVALWSKVSLRMAQKWQEEHEDDELMDRMADVYDSFIEDMDGVVARYKYLFPELSDKEVNEDFGIQVVPESEEETKCY